jgi:hypothetical protein
MEQNIESTDWSNSIFSIDAWSNVMGPLSNKEIMRFVYYILSIILYIISFKFLFQDKSTEYITSIFLFILNSVFPFLWIEDFRRFYTLTGSPLMKYKGWGLGISSIFVFIGMLLVLITNERVRKEKVHKSGEDNTVKDLHLKDDPKKEHKDKVIKITFVTVVVMMWAMVGETFSSSNGSFASFNKYKLYKNHSTAVSDFVTIIKWLLDQPYEICTNVDKLIHQFTHRIPMSPLVKCFATYCVVFIISFFGLFVRIPHHPEEIKHKMDRFEIVNMTNVFTPIFHRNYQQYRDICLFVWGAIASSVFVWLLSYIPNGAIPPTLTKLLNLLAIGGSFGSLFGVRNLFDLNKTKQLVISILAFIFAIVGTPVVLALLKFLFKFGIGKVFMGIVLTLIFLVLKPLLKMNMDVSMDNLKSENLDGTFESIKNSLGSLTGINKDNYLLPLSIVVGLSLFSTIMVDSNTTTTTKDLVSGVTTTSKKWMYNNKSLKMFIVVLICMTISLFLSLSVQYNTFYHLYRFLKNLMEFTVVYLTPLASIAVAIVHFVFSLKNHDKFKNRIHVKKND